MLKTSKPTQEPAQSGRGRDGTGREGRGGEGVNKVLQPAQSVRLKASIRYLSILYCEHSNVSIIHRVIF